MSPGMEVPEPGGTMKKMSFEFTDPAQAAAAAPQIPQGAGVPPAGMQGAMPPAGMQPQAPDPSQGGAGSMFGAMAGQAGGMPQGGDSSMFSDEQLASMLSQDPINPIDLQADQMNDQLMGGQADPALQMQMMEAARRRGGF